MLELPKSVNKAGEERTLDGRRGSKKTDTMGGEGANDVAFLLPSPPSRWNAIDDVRVTHLIICHILPLAIQKGGE